MALNHLYLHGFLQKMDILQDLSSPINWASFYRTWMRGKGGSCCLPTMCRHLDLKPNLTCRDAENWFFWWFTLGNEFFLAIQISEYVFLILLLWHFSLFRLWVFPWKMRFLFTLQDITCITSPGQNQELSSENALFSSLVDLGLTGKTVGIDQLTNLEICINLSKTWKCRCVRCIHLFNIYVYKCC